MTSNELGNLQQFLRLLSTATSTANLYHPQHPQVLRLVEQGLEWLHQLVARQSSVTLKIIDEQLIYSGQQVPHSLAVQRLIAVFHQQQISYLQFEAGVSAQELLKLVTQLSRLPGSPAKPFASEHIKFGQLEVRYAGSGSAADNPFTLKELVTREVDHFGAVYRTLNEDQQLDINGLTQIVDNFIHSFSNFSDAFLALAPLRSLDEYTYTHSTNICLLNLAQARLLGIEGALLSEIGIAALLHDVGKIFIPPQILSKTSQLTNEEWQVMQQHPRLGAEYLLTTPGVPRLAVVTAYEHHMRYDGAGYPQPARRPWQQSLCSYMTAIADTFDAMRTRRAYEESLQLDQIINIMLDLAGNKLHPQLTYSFLRLLNQLDQGDSPFEMDLLN